MSEETKFNTFNIYELNRNSKCPCGSGQKIKRCHKNILELRHKAVQDKINMKVAYSAHNRMLESHGEEKMSEAQWKLYLEEKRLEEEAKEVQNV